VNIPQDLKKKAFSYSVPNTWQTNIGTSFAPHTYFLFDKHKSICSHNFCIERSIRISLPFVYRTMFLLSNLCISCIA